MLFKRHVLVAISSGQIDLAFRRWRRPTVKAGGTLRTAIRVLRIEAIEDIGAKPITTKDARRAGFESPKALLAQLGGHGSDPIYKIRLTFEGSDPRIALRERATLTASDRAAIIDRLATMDRRGLNGAWTERVLRLIDKHPGRRAPDLAAMLGRETQPFKAQVRRLKELGLTESLEVGYRLSPRGRKVLGALK